MSETTPDLKGARAGYFLSGTAGDEEARDIFAELDDLSRTSAEALGVDTVMISVMLDDVLHTLGSHPAMKDDWSARRHDPPDTVCMRTIEREGVLRVDDTRLEPDLSGLRYVTERAVVGYLGVPVYTATHGMIGSICAISSEPRKWTDFEQRYMEQLSRTVACTVLAGMWKAEQCQLSAEFSELDRVVASLAASLSVPTSVYTESGELAFANASLTALVPLEIVSSNPCRGCVAGGGTDTTDMSPADCIVDVPDTLGRIRRLRVSCVKSASGMTVCHWLPGANEIN